MSNVACVNACAGITNEQLEAESLHQYSMNLVSKLSGLEQQRDDLQALCRELVDALEDIARGHLQEPSFERHAVASAKLALNKARGKL